MHLRDANRKVDLALLRGNGDSAVLKVAAAIIWTRKAYRLLDVKLECRKRTLSTGIRSEADTTRVGGAIAKQDMGGPTKSNTNHTRNTVVIKSSADVKLVD